MDEADGRDLWFGGGRVRIVVAQADNADALSVLAHEVPGDEGPPLHVHHREDELFQILEGTVLFEVDGRRSQAGVGDTVFAPRGSVHSYRAGPDGARFLTITRGGFERMVRRVSRPAAAPGLPPRAVPTPAERAALAAACAAEGNDLVGPPLA